VKTVIASILETEKEARVRVVEAGEKAKAVRLKAEEDAKALAASVREKAQKEAQALIAGSETEAQGSKEKELAKAAQEGKSLWKDKEKEISKAVDALFNILVGEGKR
jgi:vacuolar-type H+-ATPase subunit H